MVTLDGDPIDPAGQGVLFYLYSPDLAALRVQLLANGVDVGEISDGTPAPRQQMKLTDLDGYRADGRSDRAWARWVRAQRAEEAASTRRADLPTSSAGVDGDGAVTTVVGLGAWCDFVTPDEYRQRLVRVGWRATSRTTVGFTRSSRPFRSRVDRGSRGILSRSSSRESPSSCMSSLTLLTDAASRCTRSGGSVSSTVASSTQGDPCRATSGIT